MDTYPLSLPGAKTALIPQLVEALTAHGLDAWGSRIAVPCLGTAAAALGLRTRLGVQIVHASDASPLILCVLRALRQDRSTHLVEEAFALVRRVLDPLVDATESSARFFALRNAINAVAAGVGAPRAENLRALEAARLRGGDEAAARAVFAGGEVSAAAAFLAVWRLSAQQLVRCARAGGLNSPPRWSERTPRPRPDRVLDVAGMHWLAGELRRGLPLPVFADACDVVERATPVLEGELGGLDWVYVDPPYVGVWAQYTGVRFDHARLFRAMRGAPLPVICHNAHAPEEGTWETVLGDGLRWKTAIIRRGTIKSKGPRPSVEEVLLCAQAAR